jgi:hypothetical protein
MQSDSPITTVEEARRYFQSMGCTHFHMGREDPDRYEEYRKLGISKDQERKWAAEEIAAKIAQLNRRDTDEAALPDGFFNLENILANWKVDHFLEEILRAFHAIAESLPPSDEVLVARTIIGSNPVWPPGLMVQSHDAGRMKLARKFAELAHRLLARPQDGGFEKGRQRLLAELKQKEVQCGISSP